MELCSMKKWGTIESGKGYRRYADSFLLKQICFYFDTLYALFFLRITSLVIPKGTSKSMKSIKTFFSKREKGRKIIFIFYVDRNFLIIFSLFN